MIEETDNTGEQAAPPAAKEPPVKAVPLPRFNEVNERRKAAEAEAESLRKQIDEFKAREAAAAEKAAKEPPQEAEEEQEQQSEADSAPKIDPERYARLEIQAALRCSEQGAEMIRAYMAKGLDLQDASAMAKLKAPTLFSQESRGFNPKAHAAAPPATGRPKQQPEPTKMQKIAATQDPHRRQALALEAATEAIRAQMKAQWKK